MTLGKLLKDEEEEEKKNVINCTLAVCSVVNYPLSRLTIFYETEVIIFILL